MKTKTIFFCTECGAESAKWLGKCPACGSWNTLVEAPERSVKAGSAAVRQDVLNVPHKLSELDCSDEIRFSTYTGELDRVLGGGAVRGSVVLFGGAPGIGKSTLLLQICGQMPEEKILYVTGEESRRQLKLRAERLGVTADKLYIFAETDINAVSSAAEKLQPSILICDSIQTMFSADVASAPGSVSQVKDCTLLLTALARKLNMTTFLVGHVNKEGAIAGPKVLEHMVDCVLYFEGERGGTSRILRAAKNRFGSTNEIGVFEMTGTGLREIANPSEMLLSGRPDNCSGTCVTCVMEGSRPILAEIQALVTPSGFSTSRRATSNGVDVNRAALLTAVLEKRGGLSLSSCDTYLNVVGGLRLDETAADLATVLAIASSFRDVPVGNEVVAIGEVGLTGEVRSVAAISQRLAEAVRLGFTRCYVPAHVKGELRHIEGIEVIPVRNIREAIMCL